ncbi:hypothetical protein [Nocardia spumae]|uniref:hypothetical protein n=1 Tax=Nocardia spumae TaxID=2887190 RepID=UPI001D14BA88|nr:hypothetical protein [Nocardia spumae]
MPQQSAQSRSTGQILQHTAVVLAGMASIGLTVAAGTYIVNQIGETHRPGVISAPEGANVPAPEPDRAESPAPTTTPVIGTWGLAADSRPLQVVVAGPVAVPYRVDTGPVVPPTSATATMAGTHPGGVGGRLNLTDDTYVGANLASSQRNSLTVTLDTNLPAALSTTDTPEVEPPGDSSSVTEFRTDVDVHRGEFSLAMSDPVLGRHDMQVQRHARPAPIPVDRPQRIAPEDAAAPVGHAVVAGESVASADSDTASA